MVVQITHKGKSYSADLSDGIDLGSIYSNTIEKKAFGAADVRIEPFKAGDFIGEIKSGSSVNFRNVFLNPHGNGTHTESAAHIYDVDLPVYKALKKKHFTALLISVDVHSVGTDKVVLKEAFKEIDFDSIEALIIRCPKEYSIKDYTNTNPPFIAKSAVEYLVENGIKHLVFDQPSVDKEYDGGKLEAHKAFFGSKDTIRKDVTITEMVVLPEDLKDGLYLLNIQIFQLDNDASPSNLTVYPLV